MERDVCGPIDHSIEAESEAEEEEVEQVEDYPGAHAKGNFQAIPDCMLARINVHVMTR